MRDAEALLLVHDEQAEVAELHILREQTVSADDDLDLAGGEILERRLLLRLGAEPADHVGAYRERREPVLQGLQVLEREHGGRREDGDLLAVHHRLERGAHRHFGLAIADVAAQQPIHRRRRLHVALDVGDRRALIGREIPVERVFELLLPVRVRAEGVALHRLARGVELEQLFGHVAHGLLDAGLRLFPGRTAKPVERRARGSGVTLDQVEAFDRHEELVVARIPELHELLRLDAHLDALESDEHTDAVIDVDDEIADFQIAEVREEGGGGRAPALVDLALLFEDVGLGPELETRFRQPEPLREVAGADQHAGPVGIFGALDRHREDVVVGEQLDGAFGTAGRVGDEEDGVAALASAANLRHPVLDAAVELHRRLTGHVARLCVGIRVAADLEGLEERGAFEPACAPRPRSRSIPLAARRALPWRPPRRSWRDLLRELLAVRMHFVRLRDQDDRTLTAPQVVEDGRRSILPLVLVIGGDQLLQRRDRRLVERGGRSLRRRVVGADRLDRVAHELEPERLARARREEVDHAAANAELARLVDRVLPRIAGGCEQVAEIDR